MIIVLKSRNIELDYPTKKKVPNQLSTNARKKLNTMQDCGIYLEKMGSNKEIEEQSVMATKNLHTKTNG